LALCTAAAAEDSVRQLHIGDNIGEREAPAWFQRAGHLLEHFRLSGERLN
jgi:hypothetical protein